MTTVACLPISRRARTALLAAATLVCVLPAAPAGAAELNVSGKWDAVYHCEKGSCAGSDFPAPGVELVQAPGSTHVQSGPEVEGTLTGQTLTLAKTTGSYQFSETVTISADGNSWSGPLSDSNGTSGTDTATRVSGGPGGEPKKEEPGKKEEAKGAHATGMTVSCNYDELTSQDTCTATVADTYVSPTAPSGSVTFSSAEGGLFAFGRSCPLASSPSAPGTASCSVQYLPSPGGGFPNMSAAYPGNATHAACNGSTRFILPGGTPASYDSSSPDAGGYPGKIVVEVKTPVVGTEVRAGVTKGRTGSAEPVAGKTLRASEDPDIVPEMRTEVEERDREQRYPDIVPEMRKEVEEREIDYEADIARLRKEINESKRQAGGLNAVSQAQENTMITDDVTVIQQIAQQENSPALKNDPASQPALKKLDHQKQEMEAAVKSSLRIFEELTGPVLKSLKSSVLAQAHAAKVTTKAVILGAARRVSRSATTKVKIHISRATLTRLLRGRHSVTVNLRIVTVIPSSLLKSGIPLSTIRQVKLSKTAPRHRHKP
jgi:hypothetical protein